MGSGKSSVGKRLANRLDLEFVDMDRLIESFAKATVDDIFDKSGEETFRSLENHILEKLLNDEPKVIATGGGTPCHSGNMAKIMASGYAVYLDVPPNKLVKRVKQSKQNRPLIREKTGEDLFTFIKKHLESREVYYDQAHLRVDGDRVNSKLLDEIKDSYLDWVEVHTK
jgi:shikimate kinase